MSAQRVLITGGAGFLGVNLAAHLISHGYEVTALDNESMGHRGHLPEGARFVHGDLRDRDRLAGALEGQEVIVHLAADTRVMDSIADPRFNFENNVVGSFNLLEAARAAGIRRLLAASTGGAILGEVEPPVHEDMLPEPLAPYGPRSYHKGSVVAHFIKRVLAAEPLIVYGDGSQTRDFLYVGDLVEGVRRAIQSDATGAYQLGSGLPTTMDELIAALARVTGRKLDVRYEPFRAGELHRTWCDISKARGAFGFEAPTSLEEGLALTWDWFLKREEG